jgi:hypothetical protein
MIGVREIAADAHEVQEDEALAVMRTGRERMR